MMTETTLKALKKIAMYDGRPFYAEDYGINGGSIRALSNRGIIAKTGNVKTELIKVNDKDLYRKIEVSEWEMTKEGLLLAINCVKSDSVSINGILNGVLAHLNEILTERAVINDTLSTLEWKKLWIDR